MILLVLAKDVGIWSWLLVLTSCCLSCKPDRSISLLSNAEIQLVNQLQLLPSKSNIRLTSDQDDGEKLVMAINFVEKESKYPLGNQGILIYQANHEGQYHPQDPSDESTAKLNGQLSTNQEGWVLVHTILPGDYGRSQDNRHIHLTVPGATPEAYDIHFAQYANWGLRRFVSKSDQHVLCTLKEDSSQHLFGIVTIEVKGMNN